MEKFEELKAKVAEIEAEAEKFYVKGNKAAGTRLRKGLQEIKNLSQEIRVDVSEKKKAEAVA
jgi:hypothetical protein|tara:strand:+ start:1499 stop:1684 length:186 start_codon:yes stop_codon:yes gene_type:complete